MRARLLIAAWAALAAGAAAAQIKDHDLPVQAIMATAVNPGALAFWAGGNDAPEGETTAQAAARSRTTRRSLPTTGRPRGAPLQPAGRTSAIQKPLPGRAQNDEWRQTAAPCRSAASSRASRT